MRVRWEDLNVRARGLATHLADEGTLDALSELDEPGRLRAELVRRELVVRDTAGDAREGALERALARRRGERLGLVARWAGDRVPHLAPVFLEEDRRSVRSLARGVLGGTPPGRRLAGLCPTPSLPAAELERLAGVREATSLAVGLEGLEHPLVPPVRRLAEEAAPDLFVFELRLSRVCFEAARPSWRAGRLRRFHADSVDLENAWTVLLSDGFHGEVEPASAFLEGGEVMDAETFGAIFEGRSPEDRRGALADAFEASFAGPALADDSIPLAELPRHLLDARIREERRVGRARPHTAAPLLEYLLRLRAEAAALRRLLWGLALTAPVRRRRP